MDKDNYWFTLADKIQPQFALYMTSDMQVMFSPGIPFRNYLKSTKHYASYNLVMKQKSCLFMWLFYAAVSICNTASKAK